MWDIVPVHTSYDSLTTGEPRPPPPRPLLEVMYDESLRQLSAYLQYELESEEQQGGTVLPDHIRVNGEHQGVSPQVERVAEGILRSMLQDPQLSSDKTTLHRAIDDAVTRFVDMRTSRDNSQLPHRGTPGNPEWTRLHTYPDLGIGTDEDQDPRYHREKLAGRSAADLIGLVKQGDQALRQEQEQQQQQQQQQQPSEEVRRYPLYTGTSKREVPYRAAKPHHQQPQPQQQRSNVSSPSRRAGQSPQRQPSALPSGRLGPASPARPLRPPPADTNTSSTHDNQRVKSSQDTDTTDMEERKDRLMQYQQLRDNMADNLEAWKRQGDEGIVDRLNQSLDRWQTRLAKASALAEAAKSPVRHASFAYPEVYQEVSHSGEYGHHGAGAGGVADTFHPGLPAQYSSQQQQQQHSGYHQPHTHVPVQMRPENLSPNRTSASVQYPVSSGPYPQQNAVSASLAYDPNLLQRASQQDAPVLHQQGSLTVQDVTELNLNNYDIANVMRSDRGLIGRQSPSSPVKRVYVPPSPPGSPSPMYPSNPSPSGLPHHI